MATMHDLHKRIYTDRIVTVLRFDDKRKAVSLRGCLKQYNDRCRAQDISLGLEVGPLLTIHMQWNAENKTATFSTSETAGKKLIEYEIVE